MIEGWARSTAAGTAGCLRHRWALPSCMPHALTTSRTGRQGRRELGPHHVRHDVVGTTGTMRERGRHASTGRPDRRLTARRGGATRRRFHRATRALQDAGRCCLPVPFRPWHVFSLACSLLYLPVGLCTNDIMRVFNVSAGACRGGRTFWKAGAPCVTLCVCPLPVLYWHRADWSKPTV